MKNNDNKLKINNIKLPFDFNNIEISGKEEFSNRILFLDFISLYQGYSHVGIFYKRNSNILNIRVFYDCK